MTVKITMETRYYLFQGQTLENTKIVDRGLALHCTQSEWDRIHQHLDRKRLQQEALDKEKAHRIFLKEASKAMTKHWDNSVENIRKRHVEDRKKSMEEKEAAKLADFYKLRAEQEEIRNQYIKDVRKKIFIGGGYPKSLSSALVTSEIFFVRDKQLEIKKKLKMHEIVEEAKYAEEIKKQAEKYQQIQDEKERKEKEKNLAYQKDLRQEYAEKIKREQDRRQAEIEEEKLIVEATEKEMRVLKQLEINKQNEIRKWAKEDKLKALERHKEEQLKRIRQDKELEEVAKAIYDQQLMANCEKKVAFKEKIRDTVDRRAEASKKIFDKLQEAEKVEEIRIRRSIDQKDKLDQEKLIASIKRQEQLKNERIKDYQDFLARKARQESEANEIKKWEMLNRYKCTEAMKEYEKEKKKEAFQKMKALREDLLEQIQLSNEEKARQKMIEDAVVLTNYKEQDDKFFDYAEEVLQLAKSRGRSTYPIEKVVNQYKRDMGLVVKKYPKNTRNEGKIPIGDKYTKKCKCFL